MEWSGLTVVATYPYVNADGALLYRVVRSEPKRFRMEVPDGHGGWRSGRDCMAGVQRVLYRLPEVLTAVQAGETVFVVEGEKDVDLLAGSGVCAVTAAGGAGKWGSVPDAAVVLSGANVVVIPDRDSAGWRHAIEVTESLAAGIAVTVRAAAVGNDYADHAAAGHGVEDLLEIDPHTELETLAEFSTSQDTFAILPRSIIRFGDRYCLDDACVRLYAVVDEHPNRKMSGRNEIARVLGWSPPKVTEHADHLGELGLFSKTKHPSGGGYKADTYSIAYNPARKGQWIAHLSLPQPMTRSQPCKPPQQLSMPTTSASPNWARTASIASGGPAMTWTTIGGWIAGLPLRRTQWIAQIPLPFSQPME